MPPPSLQPQHNGKFKPGSFRPPGPSASISARDTPHTNRTSNMPPPALPRSGIQPFSVPLSRASDSALSPRLVSVGNNYAPTSHSDSGQSRMRTPLPESLPTQRFVPSTPSRRQQMPVSVLSSASRSSMQPQAFSSNAMSSRAPSRLAAGQRMPFVPST